MSAREPAEAAVERSARDMLVHAHRALDASGVPREAPGGGVMSVVARIDWLDRRRIRPASESGEVVAMRSGCEHDYLAQPDWSSDGDEYIVRLTCGLCGATTEIDLGDVLTNEWSAPQDSGEVAP